jgi:hypothetical protein
MEELAFRHCLRLSSIVIPSSLEQLGSGCFDGCPSLSIVVFGSGSKLSQLGAGAFSGCSQHVSIRIPSSLQPLFSEYVGHLVIVTGNDQETASQ